MSAFTTSQKYDIEQNISSMYARLHHACKKKLKHEDFIQMFVPAEQRQLFREISPLMRPTAESFSFKWPYGIDNTGPLLTIKLQPTSKLSKPPIPKTYQIQRDAPPELLDMVKHWIETDGDASRHCGRIRKVFQVLNDKCSKSDMRFFWPSILAILSFNKNNEKLCKIASELQGVKSRASGVLPAGVAPACRQTAETVAMISLIPPEIINRDDRDDEVTFSIVSGEAYEEPGIGRFMGVS